MSEKKMERLKLKHKYKKEMKGAIREIRRDRSFLAKLKLKETMKRLVAKSCNFHPIVLRLHATAF